MGLSQQQLLEYFLTDNKSGWKCVPNKLNNRNPELYKEVQSFLNTSNIPNDIKFKQKIWHFIHNETNVITCKECGGVSKFLDIRRGYQDFCSVSCSNKNKDKIETTKKNNIKKWGVGTPFQNKSIYSKYLKLLKEKHGVTNVGQITKVKRKIETTNLERYGYKTPFGDSNFRNKWNQKTSKIEKIVSEKLNCQHKFILEGKEYDLKMGNYLIEIDGDYHHPKNTNNLSLIQLSSIINDHEKEILAEKHGFTLIRINTSKLKDINVVDMDYILNNSYKQDYSLGYDDVILSKGYLTKYLETHSKDKLNSQIYLLLKFVRTFQKDFPYPTTIENIIDITDKISNSVFKEKMVDGKLVFNNNTSNIGVSLLKSVFTNYWSSSYKGNGNPIDLWYDDEFMRKIISYRVGLNDSGEIFDFSIKNIIKGFSANRINVSFFKPMVAANIYKHYLGDKPNPVVFDPCFGFGGRLLGFKSIYPNGKYIGVDYDINGYNNIQKLSNQFDNVELFNSSLEEFDNDITYDIAFTSIPYYDLEEYSNNIMYSDFDEWKNTFIKKLLSYPNLLVNMSYKLCEQLNLTEYIDSFIESNTSHFNKKNNKKMEVIIKINF